MSLVIRALAVLVCVTSFSLSTSAATIITDGSGKIAGANDVIVNGDSYDVSFIDGTCVALFSGCDESSDFVFTTSALAQAASQALLDQVFLDFDALQTFDADPEKTVGCTNSGLCRALTVFALSSTPGTVAGVTADNNQFEVEDIVTLNIGVGDTLDLGDVTIATYAVWTANSSAVPLPPTAYLMSLSLAGLILARSRSRQYSSI